jgi:SAM-dependent methyltransferase
VRLGHRRAGADQADAGGGPDAQDTIAGRLRRMRNRLRRLEAWTQAREAGIDRAIAHEHHARSRLDRLDVLLDHVDTVPASDKGGLRVPDAEGRSVMGYSDAQPLEREAAYVEFEALFRGSRAEIQQRQRPYVDLLAGAAPVLDLGCGRGEFLELLREAGVPAQGVDLDAGMVKVAADLGLNARVGDLFDTLADTADGSVGAVVSFQVVEHLELDDLDRLLAETHRVLAPEGIVVLETVNPHSLRAYRFFWLDVTHRIPLFPESLLSLARGRGFAAGVAWFSESSGELTEDLRECGDYALVCAKTAAPLVARGLIEDARPT